MNSKHLHIHTSSLLLAVIAATGVLAISVQAERGNEAASAVLRSAIGRQLTDREPGSKLTQASSPTTAALLSESAGITDALPAKPADEPVKVAATHVTVVLDASKSLAIQMALDDAVAMQKNRQSF